MDAKPIEYVWNLVKQRVADKNVSQTEKDIEKLNTINSITEEDWKKVINHVDRLRQQYWANNRLQEFNELIISAGDASDNSDTEWSDDSDTETSDFDEITGIEVMDT